MARTPGSDRRVAFRPFLGRSILSHQIDCAIAAGCETIVCLVDGIGPDLIEGQHRAEKGGARFQTIAGSHGLSALVRADDQLVVFADGMLSDPTVILDHVGERRVVLTLPADPFVTMGFERIDAMRAWAGMLTLRGDQVERLMQLPDDAEPASALMRIALQGGARTHPLDPGVVTQGRWCQTAHTLPDESARKAWIGHHVTPAGFAAPGRAIAERIGIRLSRDVLGRRSEHAALLVALVSGLVALALALSDRPVAALIAALPMVLALPIADIIERVSQIGRGRRGRFAPARLRARAADGVLAGVVASALPPIPGANWLALFLATSLIGTLWVGERAASGWAREMFADRATLVAVLLVAALFGVFLPIAAALVLVALAVILLSPIRAD